MSKEASKEINVTTLYVTPGKERAAICGGLFET